MSKAEEHLGFGETGEVTIEDDSVPLVCETGDDGVQKSSIKASDDDLEEEIPMSFPQRVSF